MDWYKSVFEKRQKGHQTIRMEEKQMKKLIGLMAIAIFLFSFFSIAEAKPYKALTKEVSSPVEIPDEVILPDYLSRLEYAETIWFFGTPLMVSSYKDPEFHYINENGDEIPPYNEVIKLKNNQTSLVGIFFVNDKNVIEFYVDEGYEKSATGTFKKYIPKKEDTVKKVPREKQSPEREK